MQLFATNAIVILEGLLLLLALSTAIRGLVLAPSRKRWMIQP